MRPIIPSSWNRDWVIGILLLAFTLAVYHPAWNGALIWDDDDHITKPELQSVQGLACIWMHPRATMQYYPLVHSVFWMEHRFWGDNTLGYHLLNILLHILSAFLLVRTLRFLQIPGAWLAGAIFALHPVMVESVAWITEIKNTLSGVFFLSTALLYLRFDQERKKWSYITALGLFILGLLSKSVIATLPASLLALFWWKRGTIKWKQDVIPLLPFFVVGIASGLFTAWVERKFIGAEGGEFNFSIIERCLIAGRAVWFYLSKLFWPVDLVFIYPRWIVSQAVWWQYLFPLATLLFIWILWALRKRSRTPLAVFLYFTITIFPVMGFFNVFPFYFSFVADHFQYLAAIGPIVLTAAGGDRLFGLLKGGNRFLKPAGILIPLLVLGVLSWKQSGVYTDAETLYRITIRKNPTCWLAYNNLGFLLENAGQTGEAITCYLKTLEINTNYSKAHTNLGNVLAGTGRTDEAIVHYRKALEIDSNDVTARLNLGTALLQIGRNDEAIASYRKVLASNPNVAEAYNNLGNVLLRVGQTDEAIINYQKALKINPNKVNTLKNLANAFTQKGQYAEAVSLLQRALEVAKSTGDEGQVEQISERLELLNQASRYSSVNPKAGSIPKK